MSAVWREAAEPLRARWVRRAWAAAVLVLVLICWPVVRCPWCRRQVWGWGYSEHLAAHDRVRAEVHRIIPR